MRQSKRAGPIGHSAVAVDFGKIFAIPQVDIDEARKFGIGKARERVSGCVPVFQSSSSFAGGRSRVLRASPSGANSTTNSVLPGSAESTARPR